MAPQIIWITLCVFAVVSSIVEHGKPRTGLAAEQNAYVTLVRAVLWNLLFWWGGFFDAMFR